MTAAKWIVIYYLLVQAEAFYFEKQGIFMRQAGYRIEQGVFDSVTAHTVMDCVTKCINFNICKSVNYLINKKKCDLSNKNKRLVTAAEFTADPGYLHYEKDLCDPSPCVFASGCAMDTGDLGFKCSCLAGYKGNQCEKNHLQHLAPRPIAWKTSVSWPALILILIWTLFVSPV